MFDIRQRGSTVAREIVGGLTTFAAMSYILFVQPTMLQATHMDFGGVFMATCIASAAACFLMGLLANYPIALAPGMGENVLFVSLCAGAFGLPLAWPDALLLTALAGGIFLLLATVGLRSWLMNSIPNALKSGIAAGIGLFIALIGLQWGNLVVANPFTALSLAPLKGNSVAALTLLGLALTVGLLAWRIHGAILLGILLTTAATLAAGTLWNVPTLRWTGAVVGMPHGLSQTAGGLLVGIEGLNNLLLDHPGSWVTLLSILFVLLFMDLFDTVGTLVGVASRADLIDASGRLPRAERALAADAGGTVLGALLGTSTVTSYIESITGVASGARTGLAAIVSGLCLLAAMFFQPLVEMVGAGVPVALAGGGTAARYPMIAPALILVGALMMRAMRDVAWDDPTEAVPAFLTMVTIPFGYSIAAGIAMGFVSYAVIKLLTGKARQCPLAVYLFAALFVVLYVWAMPA